MQACSVLGRLAFALRIYFLQMAHDASEAAFSQIQMSNRVVLPRSAQTLAALLHLKSVETSGTAQHFKYSFCPSCGTSKSLPFVTFM